MFNNAIQIVPGEIFLPTVGFEPTTLQPIFTAICVFGRDYPEAQTN